MHPYFLLLLIIYSTSVFAQRKLQPKNSFVELISKPDSFIVSGKISGRDTGKIYLWYTDQYNQTQKDTCLLKRGYFIFKGKIKGGSYAILFTNNEFKNLGHTSNIHFFIDANKIQIHFSKGDEQNALITGSKLQDEKLRWDKQKELLNKQYTALKQTIDSLVKMSQTPAIQSEIAIVKQQMKSNTDSIKQLDLGYINKNKNSLYSAYLLWKYTNKVNTDIILELYNSLTEKIQNSSFGEFVLTEIKTRQKKKVNEDKAALIKNIYDLELKDSAGNIFQFKELKGKVVLLDFWASWCSLCIKNIPTIKQLEKRTVTDSVFKIVSISFDEDTTKWKKAIAFYKLGKIQLIDTDGFSSILATLFNASSIPRYILVGKDGTIINNSITNLSSISFYDLIKQAIEK